MRGPESSEHPGLQMQSNMGQGGHIIADKVCCGRVSEDQRPLSLTSKMNFFFSSVVSRPLARESAGRLL